VTTIEEFLERIANAAEATLELKEREVDALETIAEKMADILDLAEKKADQDE